MSTVHLDLLRPAWEAVPRPIPWTIIGVVPTAQQYLDHGGVVFHSSTAFAYTVSDGPAEMWCPLASVEDRYGGPDLISATINVLFAGLGAGVIQSGDDVLVPFGIPDENGAWSRDADAVFWIGEAQHDPRHQRFQCHMAPHVEWVIPVRWSSPLGWED